MVYLYAGLGIAMLSGIMAIFEMGLAVTGQSLIPSPVDAYLTDSNVKRMDRALLGLLSNPAPVVPEDLVGTNLCNAIRSVYQANYPFPAQQFSFVEDSRSLVGTAWEDSCVMDDGNHRVLIKPDGSSYKFYSCVKDDREDRCSFEQGS